MIAQSNINAFPARFAVFALALTLLGCATDQSPAAHVAAASAGPIPPGQAAITLTRTEGYYASRVAADVDVNGARFTSIDMGASFTGAVRPGPVDLSVTCTCGPGHYTVHFKAEAGRRYAFEISPRNEQVGAMVVGGLVGLAVDTAAHGENGGTFKLTEVTTPSKQER